MVIAGNERIAVAQARHPGPPSGNALLIVPDNVIAVLGQRVFVANMPRGKRGGIIQCIRKPRRITHESFMLGAMRVLIPTARMPRVVSFTDHLRNFSRRIIATGVVLAINAKQYTDGRAGALEIGNSGSIIPLHVVLHHEAMAVPARVPMARIGRSPNGGRCRAGQRR